MDALHECRNAVLEPIAEALDRPTVDELATDQSVDEICVNEVKVVAIGPETFVYLVTGSVEVRFNEDRTLTFDVAMARKRSRSNVSFGWRLMIRGISTSPSCPTASKPANGMTQ